MHAADSCQKTLKNKRREGLRAKKGLKMGMGEREGNRDSITWQRCRPRGRPMLDGQGQLSPGPRGKIIGKTAVEKQWKQEEGSSETRVTDWQGGAAGIQEPSAMFSLHMHAHRIYAWCERRNRIMMPKQERKQS